MKHFDMPVMDPPPREFIDQRLSDKQVLKRDGHYVYASRKHGPDYFAKDVALCDPWLAAALGFDLAAHLITTDGLIIVGPATAGIALAHHVSDAAARRRPGVDYLTLYADKEGDRFVFKRGYDRLVKDRLVVVVEDVGTTGGSAKQVVEVVRRHGGNVVAVGLICNRGRLTAETFGVKNFYAFLELDLPQYPALDCPLCLEGRPISTELGHGRDWVERFGQPPYDHLTQANIAVYCAGNDKR